MRINPRGILCAAFLLLCGALPLVAQQEPDTTYAFILSAGGGITRNVSVFSQTPGGLDQMGFSGTVRIMWKPEYLIRAGLETGYTHIYTITTPPITTSAGTGEASAVLSAVPIQLMLSMPLWDDFELYGGAGIYIVNSHLEGFGTSLDQSVVSMGNTFALSYSRPVSEGMRLGTEVKWLYMDKFQDNNFTLHFMLYYTLSRY
jgi:hypothetical protein